MIFLSLGAGVQSSVMLMLSIRGEIDRPDHVLFADTGWESAATMAHVDWCERQCDKSGIPFHRCSNGNIRDDAIVARTADSGEYAGRWAAMPLFVDTGTAIGRIKRQCTSEYKITPLRRKQRELLGYQKGQRIPAGACCIMIGISTDEARRATPATDRWVDNLFPLIDPLRFSRADCQRWWDEHYGFISIGKSACLGCPNRSDREWALMKAERPEEWADVVDLDAKIRHGDGMRGESFLHRLCRPIDQIDFNQAQGGGLILKMICIALEGVAYDSRRSGY